MARTAAPPPAPVTANPHSWLLINPDANHKPQHFMFGVLEREYAGRINSALEFVTAKLQPVWTSDPSGVTAERVGVALPRDADDRFMDPLLLAAEVDRAAVSARPALLAYSTLYFPDAARLHLVWREGFSFAQALTDRFHIATVAALHFPGRAGSSNHIHVHILLMGPRKLDAIGLGGYEASLCSARGQKIVSDLWQSHRCSFGKGNVA